MILHNKVINKDDDVYSLKFGWCKVYEFDDDDYIIINHGTTEEPYYIYYDRDGKCSSWDKFPSLYWDEKRIGESFIDYCIKPLRLSSNYHSSTLSNKWYAFKHFLRYESYKWISSMYDKLDDLYHWFLYRFHPKHRYNIIKIGPPKFYEYNTQMERAIFLLYCKWWEEDLQCHSYLHENEWDDPLYVYQKWDKKNTLQEFALSVKRQREEYKRYQYYYEKAKEYLEYKDMNPYNQGLDVKFNDNGVTINKAENSQYELWVKFEEDYEKEKFNVLVGIVERISNYWT